MIFWFKDIQSFICMYTLPFEVCDKQHFWFWAPALFSYILPTPPYAMHGHEACVHWKCVVWKNCIKQVSKAIIVISPFLLHHLLSIMPNSFLLLLPNSLSTPLTANLWYVGVLGLSSCCLDFYGWTLSSKHKISTVLSLLLSAIKNKLQQNFNLIECTWCYITLSLTGNDTHTSYQPPITITGVGNELSVASPQC